MTYRAIKFGVKHSLRLFILLVLAPFVVAPNALGQRSDNNWVLLETVAVAKGTNLQLVHITAPDARVSAIRLVAKNGPLRFSRLIINYGNGRVHYEDRSISLRTGERTPEIDARDGETVVQSVVLAANSSGVAANPVGEVEIWGRRTRVQIVPAEFKTRGERREGDETVAKDRGYFEVPVFFGTTRKKENVSIKNSRELAKFGNSQPDGLDLTLGRAVVTVPYDRPAGSIGRPDTNLILFTIAFRNEDPSKDFTLLEVKELTSKAFVDGIKQQGTSATNYKNQAFVFVHGFNVGFDDAIFRTAQIAKDVGFDGPAVAFSWRSAGGMLNYRHDIDAAKGARVALRDLLTILVRDCDVKSINLVAHSMGNDPVIEVLRENVEIRLGGGSPPDFRLNEVVFAAPDVARHVFAQFTSSLSKIVSGGITLYASTKDRALMASKRLAGGLVRAGDIPKEGIVLVPGVESIDVSDAGTGFFSTNHSTFADRQHLIDDISLLFEKTDNKHPPDLRFRVFGMQRNASSQKWWKYRR